MVQERHRGMIGVEFQDGTQRNEVFEEVGHEIWDKNCIFRGLSRLILKFKGILPKDNSTRGAMVPLLKPQRCVLM